MKKGLYIASTIAIGVTVLMFLLNNRIDVETDQKEVLSTTKDVEEEAQENDQTVDIPHNEDVYRISWIVVGSVNKLNLIPNFEKKLTSEQALEDYDCKNLVNGGFYSKEELPIGLFFSDGDQMQRFGINAVLNGVFYIKTDGEVGISREIRDADYKLALQSGPILLKDGQKQSLDLANDKKARRVVVGTTNEEKIVFLIVYDNESMFVGPYLSELPDVVDEFNNQTDLGIVNALNLDGGAASVFYSDSVKMSEISLVGSFFCIK